VAAETPEERTARMTTLAESVKQHIFATTDLAAHAEVMRAIAADIRQVTDYKAEWGARLTTYANSHEANLRILSAVQRQVAAAQDDPGLKTILRLQEQNLARLASEPALHELAQQAIAEAERRTRPAAA
jgi:hypothetical protein